MLSPLLPFPVDQHSPQAALDDTGVGVYGQGTVTFGDKIDAHRRRARRPREQARPTSTPSTRRRLFRAPVVDAEKSFSNVSPQFAFGYHVQPRRDGLRLASAAASRPAASTRRRPPGSEAYDEEHTWNVEGGVKSAVGRAPRDRPTSSVFSIDWQRPAAERAEPVRARAVLHRQRRPRAQQRRRGRDERRGARRGVDVFGIVRLHARALRRRTALERRGRVAARRSRTRPTTRRRLGTELSHRLRRGLARLRPRRGRLLRRVQVRRGEHRGAGRLFAGELPRRRRAASDVFVEAWVRNAFDTRYIPVAFAYGQIAPSGFIGESGRPRTFGITAGRHVLYQLPSVWFVVA